MSEYDQIYVVFYPNKSDRIWMNMMAGKDPSSPPECWSGCWLSVGPSAAEKVSLIFGLKHLLIYWVSQKSENRNNHSQIECCGPNFSMDMTWEHLILLIETTKKHFPGLQDASLWQLSQSAVHHGSNSILWITFFWHTLYVYILYTSYVFGFI